MIVFGLFAPILCVVVPMVAVLIAMLIYIVAHYCISVPLSRSPQQGDSASEMIMKITSSKEAEEMDNGEGKWKHISSSDFIFSSNNDRWYLLIDGYYYYYYY